MRVALFITCVDETLAPQAGRATVTLLGGGFDRLRAGVRTMHVAEILASTG